MIWTVRHTRLAKLVQRGVLILFSLLVIHVWPQTAVSQDPQNATGPSAPEEYDDQLLEADLVLRRSQELLDLGHLQEAIDAAVESNNQFGALPTELPAAVFGRANALSLIGEAFALDDNHNRAVEFWYQAVELYELFTEPLANYAFILERLALSLERLGQVEKASESLISAADQYAKMERYQESFRHRAAALALLKELPRTPQSILSQAVITYGTARLHFKLENFTEAANGFGNSLSLLEQLSDAEDYVVFTGVLEGLAGSLGGLGRQDEAIAYFKRELELLNEREGEELTRARILTNIAHYLEEQAKYTDAADSLAKALTIYERQENAERDRLKYHRRIAEVLSLAERWNDVYDHVLKVLEILRTLDEPEAEQAEALRNLAVVLEMTSRPREAYEAYRQALLLYESVLGTEAEQTEILHRAGNVLVELDESSLALQTYSVALPLYRKLMGAADYNVEEHAVDLARTAILLHEADRNAEAIAVFREALSVTDGLRGLEYLRYQNYWGLGRVLLDSGRAEESARYLKTGLAGLGRFLTSSDILEQKDRLNEFVGFANFLYRIAIERPDVSGSLGFEAALAAKSVSSELSRLEQESWRRLSPEQGADEFVRLLELRRLVARRVLLQVSQFAEEFDPNGDELQLLVDEMEQLEASLHSKAVPVERSNYLLASSTQELRSWLYPGEMIIEYVTYTSERPSLSEDEKNRYGAFVVIAGDENVSAIDLGPTNEINRALLELRELHASQTDFTRFNLDVDVFAAQAQVLKSLILDEVMPRNAKPTRIYVIPAGLISLVPVEVLPQGRHGNDWRYFVEDYEIVYLTSARDLVRRQERRKSLRSGDVWLVGDPDFNASPKDRLGAKNSNSDHDVGKRYEDSIRNDWPRLEGLQTLLKSVEGQIQGSGLQPKVLSGPAASEENIYGIHAPRILLFATHGNFMHGVVPVTAITWSNTDGAGDFGSVFKVSMDPLMRSMLILAGANRRYHRITVSNSDGEVMLDDNDSQPQPTASRTNLNGLELSDGLLTAYEVKTMDLRDTDLVVLLGCESAMGIPNLRNYRAVGKTTMSQGIGMQQSDDSSRTFVFALPTAGDEAVAGLQQAFFIAGARSIISSLWTIALQPSADLVDDFFESLLTGENGRYVAFRAAQLKALEKSRINGNSHPFWWGSFVYVGDPADVH